MTPNCRFFRPYKLLLAWSHSGLQKLPCGGVHNGPDASAYPVAWNSTRTHILAKGSAPPKAQNSWRNDASFVLRRSGDLLALVKRKARGHPQSRAALTITPNPPSHLALENQCVTGYRAAKSVWLNVCSGTHQRMARRSESWAASSNDGMRRDMRMSISQSLCRTVHLSVENERLRAELQHAQQVRVLLDSRQKASPSWSAPAAPRATGSCPSWPRGR